MKKSKTTILMILLLVVSYASKGKAYPAAQDTVRTESKFTVEWKKFKADAEAKIHENENRVAEYKARIKTERQEARERHQKRVEELEQKNRDLKVRLETYKDERKENWEKFKHEFSQSMDNLGQAFKDLFSDKD